jgi:hypothetical protein
MLRLRRLIGRLIPGRVKRAGRTIFSLESWGGASIRDGRSTIADLEEERIKHGFDRDRLMVYREDRVGSPGKPAPVVAPVRDRLVREAETALTRGPYSVLEKTTLPPSGDPHDYWHPAPYWWPNPATADGLPYVRRDGRRVPGTEMYEPESEKYDRTRLQRMFDDTTTLALAWSITGEKKYAAHAACLVRRWFIDPDKRMNPHLRYSQVRFGHNLNEGFSSGIIEMKDLYYYLDAVRLLERADVLTPADRSAFVAWLRDYLDWLLSSPQGTTECRARNNHGTLYDVQVASIAAYVGDVSQLITTFRRSRERILQQFTGDGYQPHEMTRTMTAHYCCFNLQSWVNLATLAWNCGEDLWSLESTDGRSLRRGLEWLLPYMEQERWPYEQIGEFDRERFLPLYFAYRTRFPDTPPPVQSSSVPDASTVKPIFYPHDGVMPYWMLG